MKLRFKLPNSIVECPLMFLRLTAMFLVTLLAPPSFSLSTPVIRVISLFSLIRSQKRGKKRPLFFPFPELELENGANAF